MSREESAWTLRDGSYRMSHTSETQHGAILVKHYWTRSPTIADNHMQCLLKHCTVYLRT